MKLTKKEAQKIAEDYDLGKVKSIKTFSEGWVNDNYCVKTEKGDFVIRILGKKWDEKKKRAIKLEFKVLEHLHKKKFPYPVPKLLQNNKGKALNNIKGSKFWVYSLIPGKHIKKLGENEIKELAKALSTYHQYVRSIKGKIFKTNFKGIKRSFEKTKKLKPKTELDKFVHSNIPLFEDMLKRSRKLDFKMNALPVHSDFHRKNILWNKGKIVGIIDFDNIVITSRMRDLAHFIRSSLFKGEKLIENYFNIFIKEYNKIFPLNQKEKEIIFPFLINGNCKHFNDFYVFGKDKNLKTRKGSLHLEKWMVTTTIGSAKRIGWLK